jgi:type II secretory pathway pseudopilin PulG
MFSLRQRRSGRLAFTLVELMVAMSVLTLIVFVLFKIFDKTQRAMRSNAAQVDVMEGGRAVMDLLRRDFEQMEAPEGLTTNNVNFYVGMAVRGASLDLPGDEATDVKENFLDEIYFLRPSRESTSNEVWEATVYRVLARTNLTPNELVYPQYATNYAVEGVGWLARRSFEVPTVKPMDPGEFEPRYLEAPLQDLTHPLNHALGVRPVDWARFSQVAGGIVHFKVTPLDSRGQPVWQAVLSRDGALLNTPDFLAYPGQVAFQPVVVGDHPDTWRYYFVGGGMPASLQVELGVLEPQVVGRLNGLPNAKVRAEFLRDQAAKIHYFEQRIPLRSASKLLPNKP